MTREPQPIFQTRPFKPDGTPDPDGLHLAIYADGRVTGLPEGCLFANLILPTLYCYEGALWRMSAPNSDGAAIASDALQGVSFCFDSSVLKRLAAGEFMKTSVPDSESNCVRMSDSGEINSDGAVTSESTSNSSPIGK